MTIDEQFDNLVIELRDQKIDFDDFFFQLCKWSETPEFQERFTFEVLENGGFSIRKKE